MKYDLIWVEWSVWSSPPFAVLFAATSPPHYLALTSHLFTCKHACFPKLISFTIFALLDYLYIAYDILFYVFIVYYLCSFKVTNYFTIIVCRLLSIRDSVIRSILVLAFPYITSFHLLNVISSYLWFLSICFKIYNFVAIVQGPA